MAWTLKNYQKGGVYDPQGRARPNIVALAKYIAHKAGMPDVRLQFTPGNYAHVNGLAVDIQPGGGSGNPEGMRALRTVVENLDWDYWGIRYAAGMRHEYGGSWGGVKRKRPQTKPYVGSDGMHDRHWHLDVHATAPTRDWQSLIRGESAPAKPTPAAPSKAVTQLLTDLDYPDVRTAQTDLGLVVDGVAGPITTRALEAEMSKIREDLGKIKTAIERIERKGERNEAIGAQNQKEGRERGAKIDRLAVEVDKIKQAAGRLDRAAQEAGK